MIPWVPKEISKKIKFRNNDVLIKEGITLNEEEKKIYDKFRKNLKQGLKERIEY